MRNLIFEQQAEICIGMVSADQARIERNVFSIRPGEREEGAKHATAFRY